MDIMGGKCVRLTRGNFESKKVYDGQPLEVARRFEEAGIKRLHLVDLDGARAGKVANWKVLEQVAGGTDLFVDFGGGIQEGADVVRALEAGASRITLGSIAVKSPGLLEEWILEFGAKKIWVGADVFGEKIKVSGWQKSTDTHVFDFIENMLSIGVEEIFCTDIENDGMLEGPSLILYQKILERFSDMLLIASGGVRSIEDLEELQKVGCYGAIIGKAIYEGKISVEELVKFSSC